MQEDTRHARTLLLLARYREPEASYRKLPRVSQETLAEKGLQWRITISWYVRCASL